MIKDRGFDEVTLIQTVSGRALTAADEGRAVFASDIQILEHRVELAFIDAGTHLSLRIHAVADAHAFGPSRDAFHKFVGDLVDYHGPAGCCASLAGRSESALDRVFDRQIHVAV